MTERQKRIWGRYVSAVAGNNTQTAIADYVKAETKLNGPSQTTVGRWINQTHLPQGPEAANFARAYKRDVLEAFVAAGLLAMDEAKAGLSTQSVKFLGQIVSGEAAARVADAHGPAEIGDAPRSRAGRTRSVQD